MPFRPNYQAAAWLGILLISAGAARAEDPFLGQIKEIKCVNCKPGWVTLVVHDPIDTRDFELYLKDTDYNKIITPLPGKRIHDRDGQCFYWMVKPKAEAKPASGSAPTGAKPAQPAPGPGAKASGKPTGKADAAMTDSLLPATASAAAAETVSMVPPPLEEQGTPSSCIRFYKQMN
jgi:hypothetical protein